MGFEGLERCRAQKASNARCKSTKFVEGEGERATSRLTLFSSDVLDKIDCGVLQPSPLTATGISPARMQFQLSVASSADT